MLDPEIAHFLFGAGERQRAVHHLVRKKRSVVVDARVVLFGPSDPLVERRNVQLFAARGLGGFGIHRMNVYLAAARRQAEHIRKVLFYFLGVARRAGVVARYHVLAFGLPVFETVYIVHLPTVQRNARVFERFDRLVGVYAVVFICFFRKVVGVEDLVVVCHVLHYLPMVDLIVPHKTNFGN